MSGVHVIRKGPRVQIPPSPLFFAVVFSPTASKKLMRQSAEVSTDAGLM
jgi:hypothetical protein